MSTASPTTFWRHRHPNCQFSYIIRTWGGREHAETNFCKPCNFQFIFSLLLVFWILESLRWPKTFTEPKAQTKLLTRSLWLTKQMCNPGQYAHCWALYSTPHSGALGCQHLPKRMVCFRGTHRADGLLQTSARSVKASCRDSLCQKA